MAFILRIHGVEPTRASTLAEFEESAARDAAQFGAIVAIGFDRMPDDQWANWYVCKMDNAPRPGLKVKLIKASESPPNGYTKSAEGYFSLNGTSAVYIACEKP